MVIVTTAVYWGLNSPLRTNVLTGPLNLPAPGRRQSVYIDLKSSHGPVFLVNSRFPLFSATTTSSTRRSPVVAPLLPKLRGHFAEFLNHSSPERLSILYLTTCVGLRYGPYMHSLEAFLDSIGSPTSPQRVRITPHPTCRTDLPIPAGHTLTPQSNKWLGYLPASPHRLATTRSGPTHPHTTHTKCMQHTSGQLVSLIHHWSHTHGYGNINPLTIDYACRPRLRTRLTLGRLA